MTYKHSLLGHESEEFEVTSSNVEKILRGCEEILGTETHNVPKIVPRSYDNLAGWACSYRPKKRWVESEELDFEHNMFHELVHYSMHQDDLLITETVSLDASFLDLVYAHLVDETIADFATYSVWGYDPQTASNPVESKLADALINNFPLEEVEDCVLDLGESPFLNADYWTAIRITAIHNAKTLQSNPSELVDIVREAKEQFASPFEIYQAIKTLTDLQPEVQDVSEPTQ